MSARKDYRSSRILSSPNRFKLATFGFNSQGGSTITSAPGTVDTDWDQQVRIAWLSEAANIEAIVPGARWRGYGGDTDFQGRSFETLSWAAGLAAVTQAVQVFATVHFTTINPVRLAKTIATIDHIARGRLGINWVAGWNVAEIEMFGGTQREHDERYDYADDYLALLNQLLSTSGESAYHGPYFDLESLFSEPKPIQSPRPVYMSAGGSPRGRRFAGTQADINFVSTQGGPDGMRAIIAETKADAKTLGRDVRVFGQSSIFCADSEQEAKDYLDYCVTEKGDFAAANNLMDWLFSTTQANDGKARGAMPPHIRQEILKKLVAGHGGSLLVGTPTQVVEQMVALADLGMDGTTLSWVDFEAGLDQFREKILPLMIEAGLRTDESISTTQGN